MSEFRGFDQIYSQLHKTFLPHMCLERYPPILSPILEMIGTISLFNEHIKQMKLKGDALGIFPYKSDVEFYCRFRESKIKKIKSVLCLPLRQEILNMEDSNRETCLHYAVSKNNCDADIVDQLLKHGADPNKQNKFGDTPLHLCARFNCSSQIIEALLRYGANPNIQNLRRDTPLHVAARNPKKCERSGIVKILLENGGKVDIFNNKCRSVLHAAFENDECNLYLIEKCLENQPSLINSRDLKNLTPLHLVMRKDWKNRVIVVKILLNAGANVNAADMDMKTPLHWIQHDFDGLEFDLIISLMDRGADINSKDILDRTPLFYSIRCRCYEVSKQLILNGAKINMFDKTNKSILSEAVNGFELGEKLNPYSIKLTENTDSQIEDFFNKSEIFTPLLASEFRYDALLQLLHLRTKEGLFCVDTEKQLEVIQMLLENGADPDYGNSEYHLVPFHNGKFSAEKLLLQYRVVKNFVAAFSKEEMKNVKPTVQAMTAFDMEIFENSFREDWLKHRDVCISEVIKMTRDKLCKNLSVFKFVAERCSTTSAPRQTNFFIVDQYLLRLTSTNYPNCKDIMYAAIKRGDLKFRLLHLLIYTPRTYPNSCKEKIVALNSHVVSHIMKYLSKFDLVNLAVAYQPVPVKQIEFRDVKSCKRKLATDIVDSCSKHSKEDI